MTTTLKDTQQNVFVHILSCLPIVIKKRSLTCCPNSRAVQVAYLKITILLSNICRANMRITTTKFY